MPENLTTTPAASGLEGYNFAYLDEGTKRMVRDPPRHREGRFHPRLPGAFCQP